MHEVNEAVFGARRTRLMGLLAAQGLDAAVFGEPLTFYYLTGRMIRPMERFLALVVDVQRQDCTAIVPAAERDTMEDTGIAVRAISDLEHPMTVLQSLIPPGARLGVQMGGGYSMTYTMALAREIFLTFGMDIADVTPLTERMRLVKDELELQLIQKSADITDEALQLAKETLIPAGTADTEISMYLYQHFWRSQARPDMEPGVLVGERSALPHGGACGRRIQARDMVLIDFGACFQYYNADMTRTFFVGEPEPELRRIYEVVLQAHMAGLSAARPGVPCSAVDRAARDVITEAGYGPYFTHRVGHGLGLAVHEAPSMNAENHAVILEEGMVFTVEPGVYLPGLGGVRIEDDIAVTRDGARSFNHFPKDLASMIV